MNKIINYPDGSFYTKLGIPKFHNISGVVPADISDYYDTVFRVNSYNDLWALHEYVDAVNSLSVYPHITIPCLLDSQHDMRFNAGESFNLKLVCNFLNSMDASFSIFHPHNKEVVEALMDDVEVISNNWFIEKVMDSLKNIKDIVVLLPDGGAYKWGVKLTDYIGFKGDVLAATKNRSFKDGKSELKQQLPNYDFRKKSVILIDDICVNGGTFIGLSKLLKEQGCKDLFLAVSHLTTKEVSHELMSSFERIYTTDSKGYNYTIKSNGDNRTHKVNNLEIIKMFE